MKALVNNTPLQVEGEPAEIAQLVDLLSSGAVMVEHTHHFRLGDADDRGVQKGACWCGAARDFAPWGTPDAPGGNIARAKGLAGAAAAAAARKCRACGGVGHTARTCTAKGDGAS